MFENLREWRLATARAASVPAYVVFTDATLTAIAEQAPGDVAALSSISGVGQRKLDLYATQVLARSWVASALVRGRVSDNFFRRIRFCRNGFRHLSGPPEKSSR